MTWNSVIYRVIVVVTKSVCALVPCTAYDYIIAVCKAASLLTVTGDSVRPPETGWGWTIVACDSSGFQKGDLASPSSYHAGRKGRRRSLLFATLPAQSRDFQRSARALPGALRLQTPTDGCTT